MDKRFTIPLAACCFAASGYALGEDGIVRVGTAVDYTRGDYGTSTQTSILSIPFTARYDNDRWTLKAMLPWMHVTGAASVIPGVGQVSNTNPHRRGGATTAAASSTASGLGDLVTSATYNAYYDAASKLGVDLTGKIKWATADADQGLGTGANDYGGQIDVYETFNHTYNSVPGHRIHEDGQHAVHSAQQRLERNRGRHL